MCLRPMPALWLGALGSVSRPSIDRPGTRCRFPIPPSPSTRVSRRQQSCLPSLAPCWPPLRRSTPPWTFGQGRTHTSGWRYDSSTDPTDGVKARPDRRCPAMPQRPAGITLPMAAEMHGWAGSTRFVFKIDRVGERRCAGRQTHWVGAATPWSRAVPKSLTTNRRGQRNPSCRSYLWIPRQHWLAVRAAGLLPRSHYHVRQNRQQPCS